MKLLRLFQHPPPISEEQALQIARQICANQGWEWREPVRVIERWNDWFIQTNWPARGTNVRLTIHKQSGDLLQAHHWPR